MLKSDHGLDQQPQPLYCVLPLPQIGEVPTERAVVVHEDMFSAMYHAAQPNGEDLRELVFHCTCTKMWGISTLVSLAISPEGLAAFPAPNLPKNRPGHWAKSSTVCLPLYALQTPSLHSLQENLLGSKLGSKSCLL